MRISDIPTDPDSRTLRQFAGLAIVIFGGIASYRYFISGDADGWTIGFAIASAIGAIGLAIPNLIKPIFISWMILAFPIGWVVSHAILLLIFTLIFIPFGLVLRMLGHDPLKRRQPEANSYWVEKPNVTDPSRYLKQF